MLGELMLLNTIFRLIFNFKKIFELLDFWLSIILNCLFLKWINKLILFEYKDTSAFVSFISFDNPQINWYFS